MSEPRLGSMDWWALWCWQITDDGLTGFDEQFQCGTSRFAAVQDEE